MNRILFFFLLLWVGCKKVNNDAAVKKIIQSYWDAACAENNANAKIDQFTILELNHVDSLFYFKVLDSILNSNIDYASNEASEKELYKQSLKIISDRRNAITHFSKSLNYVHYRLNLTYLYKNGVKYCQKRDDEGFITSDGKFISYIDLMVKINTKQPSDYIDVERNL